MEVEHHPSSSERSDSHHSLGDESAEERIIELLARRLASNEESILKLQVNQNLLGEIVSKLDQSSGKREGKIMSAVEREIAALRRDILDSHTKKAIHPSSPSPSPSALKSGSKALDEVAVVNIVERKLKESFSSMRAELAHEAAAEARATASAHYEATVHDMRDVINGLEREVARGKAEAVRWRARVDDLETALREIVALNGSREEAYESLQRKTVAACRAELQRLAESTSRRVNEALSHSFDKVKAEQREREAEVKALKGTVRQLVSYRRRAEEQAALSEQVVGKLFSIITGSSNSNSNSHVNNPLRTSSNTTSAGFPPESWQPSLSTRSSGSLQENSHLREHIHTDQCSQSGSLLKVEALASKVSGLMEAHDHLKGMVEYEKESSRKVREKVRLIGAGLQEVGQLRASLEQWIATKERSKSSSASQPEPQPDEIKEEDSDRNEEEIRVSTNNETTPSISSAPNARLEATLQLRVERKKEEHRRRFRLQVCPGSPQKEFRER